jgi:type I restriction enzyme M protein
MRKSLGSKRREMSPDHIAEITRMFGAFQEVHTEETDEHGRVFKKPVSLILPNESFGYRTITVERPLRDEKGKVVKGTKGKQKGLPQPDSSLRDTENVPLAEDVEAYFVREVKPHAPDAWIDDEKTKVGYEIPFNRHFYVFKPPRPLADIDADLKLVTTRIVEMIGSLSQ